MIYLFVFLILLICYLVYQYLARYFNIIDKPNERSSHTYLTIRGGGIVFPLAACLWFLLFDFQYPWAIAGLLVIAIISFLDDLYSLSRSIRMLMHFSAVTLLFIQYSFFDSAWYYWVPVYIVFTGWINAFNFMDGINGITPFYSLVSLGTFILISFDTLFIPVEMLIVLTISVIIFAFFNARKRALAFAGDVGSVSMAFLLGWILFSLILKTQTIEYILFFAVYGVDSVFTILHRLIRKENIFKAHRTHLYQYLSNELKFSHVFVSSLYAGIQIVINGITLLFIRNEIMNPVVFILILLLLSLLYLTIRVRVLKMTIIKT